MSKPVVAIVGRPNVGKSTLFNKIIGKRIAIEEDVSGVTRDRIVQDTSWLGYNFQLVDTGGLVFESKNEIEVKVTEQAKTAISIADVILFVVDYKDGMTTSDREVAQRLYKTQKPVILVVNKVDNFNEDPDLYEFYEFGFKIIPISAANQLNIGDLLDETVKHFGQKQEDEEEQITKIAIVGRPNAGKSSLLNAMIGQERTIVSPIAGTTRDAIDVEVKYHNKKYIFTDTAGIRRRKKVNESVEHFSVIRAYRAIDRSDVAMLVVDASEGFAEQDKKIIGYAHNEGKSIIVLLNKWDLLEKDHNTYREWEKYFYKEFPFLKYAFFQPISVYEHQRLHTIMQMIEKIDENRNRRIPTGHLNDLISEAILRNVAPSDKGVRLKVYYVTQSSVNPPEFVFFVNKKEYAHFSYMRYLENTIRAAYDFSGTPIRMTVRQRGEK